MYSNVPIQILVEDDPFNAPDATKVAKTIIVKIPRDCSFKTMAQKIADQYPGIMHRVVMLYYYAKNGLKTTIYDHNIAEFWRHQLQLTNRLCVMTLNAMMLRHPLKNCSGCDAGLYGRFYVCSSCGFNLCTGCVQHTNNNGCPAHGLQFINAQLVPIPEHIVEHKQREYAREQQQHQQYLERRRAGTLASNVFQVVRIRNQ